MRRAHIFTVFYKSSHKEFKLNEKREEETENMEKKSFALKKKREKRE